MGERAGTKRITKIAVLIFVSVALGGACFAVLKVAIASGTEKAQNSASNGHRGLGRAIDFAHSLFAPPQTGAPPISEAVNSFGFEVLREYRASNPDENVVFSPVGLSAALAILYFGADGPTKTDLENVLGFEGSVVPEQLVSKVNGIDSNKILTHIANRAFVADNLKIKSSFIEAVGEVNVQSLDFKTDPAAAKKTINDFVQDKTLELNTDVFSDGDITAATQMVLVNAVYFTGGWKNKFDPNNTYEEEFRGVDGPVQTDFMEFENEEAEVMIKDLPELESIAVEFPYSNSRFAMYIVLPYEDDGWRFAEEKLLEVDAEFFSTNLTAEFMYMYVSVPKWEHNFELEGVKDILIDLGLGGIFAGADLSGVAENQEGVGVTDIIHQAKIKVDQGPCSTTAIFACECRYYPGDFTVDHPFLYFVVDKSDNTILLQGTVTRL